jgi:large subunit ribosomal protein L13
MNKERRQFHKTRQMAEMKDKKSLVDATGCTAGRLATVLAKRLLMGETINVINAEKAIVSGNVDYLKEQYEFKRDVGTRRKGPYLDRTPDRLLKRTVRGMVPYQLPNGRAAMKRLICWIGTPEEFKGKPSEKIEEAHKGAPRMSMTLAQISSHLGWTIPEVKA